MHECIQLYDGKGYSLYWGQKDEILKNENELIETEVYLIRLIENKIPPGIALKSA